MKRQLSPSDLPTLILANCLPRLLPILRPNLGQLMLLLRMFRSRAQHLLIRISTRLKLASKMHVTALQNFTHEILLKGKKWEDT